MIRKPAEEHRPGVRTGQPLLVLSLLQTEKCLSA